MARKSINHNNNMKTVITVGIGGRSYTIDEDAYQIMNAYLEKFREKVGIDYQTKEVMEDVESRISDLIEENLSATGKNVVDTTLVNKIISMVGLPDGSSETDFSKSDSDKYQEKPIKKFYRDTDDKKIGGVCSGLAAYLDVDVSLIRIIFVIALICGSVGFWVYIVFWIITPLAKTAIQKCEMRGLNPSVENIRRYSNSK